MSSLNGEGLKSIRDGEWAKGKEIEIVESGHIEKGSRLVPKIAKHFADTQEPGDLVGVECVKVPTDGSVASRCMAFRYRPLTESPLRDWREEWR